MPVHTCRSMPSPVVRGCYPATGLCRNYNARDGQEADECDGVSGYQTSSAPAQADPPWL